jgi:Sulfatase
MVTAFLKGAISGMYGVEAVFTRDEIMAVPMPKGAPDTWSLLQRVRASYMDGRSGHLYVVLGNGLSPISIAGKGYVSTHGSVWDYDRRVPMLFWWNGVKPADRAEAVETVDILPTLASLVGLKVSPASVDGQCLDLSGGGKGNCR